MDPPSFLLTILPSTYPIRPHSLRLPPSQPPFLPSLSLQPLLMDFGSCCSPATQTVTERRAALLLEEQAAAKCSPAYRPPELTQVGKKPPSFPPLSPPLLPFPLLAEINDRASFHVSLPKESNLAGSLLFPPSLHSSLPSQVLPNVPVDSRVDVWAMGCLLYCLAYGRSPFESPTEGVLRLGILK